MGRGGRRADGERNRDAILEAATALLAEAPDASVTDVARAAGVTRATVYRHFESRDALLDQMLLANAAATVVTLLEAMEELPLAEALDLMAGQVVALAQDNARLVAATSRRIQELAHASLAAEPLVEFLARRRARGEVLSELGDAWLGTCIRVLCLAVVLEGAAAGGRADELGRTLRTLVC
ncbi:TetR/AcrR family transcriptional regulator [Nocardioides sp.]|uniref:TetR/AcrR family transcriptional regulator n=1 Tax=Nocardioides sp. TaxID=35761 RepID=UPI00271566B0|nr:TetR/AcrR family transcriptional regulator [Nocardioides sp.]MDO9457756.1 helix-turn-helix domain-containing protein [Nocardioides sp.]